MSTGNSIGKIKKSILALFLLFLSLSYPLSLTNPEVAVVRTEWVLNQERSFDRRIAHFSFQAVATTNKLCFSAFNFFTLRRNEEKGREIQDSRLKREYLSYKAALQKRLFQPHLGQFPSYPSFSEPV